MWSGDGASGTWLTNSDLRCIDETCLSLVVGGRERVGLVTTGATYPWHTTLGYEKRALQKGATLFYT